MKTGVPPDSPRTAFRLNAKAEMCGTPPIAKRGFRRRSGGIWRRAAVAAGVILLSSLPAMADNLTWTNSHGTFLWSSLPDPDAANWTLEWDNFFVDSAFFTGAGTGTITLGTAITARGVSFTANGYTISGSGSNILTLASSGNPSSLADGELNVASSVSTTISAEIAGTVGLTKTGAGTLTLSGANTYSGDTKVRSGTLQVASGGSITHGSNDVFVGRESGDDGTLSIPSGSVTGRDGFVGYLAGSTGTATVGTSGLWQSLGSLYLGGSSGADGGSASVTVSGNGRLLVGDVDPATVTPGVVRGVVVSDTDASGGTLVLRNGASLTSPTTFIGYNATETGTATVMSGTWNNSAGSFGVGYFGTGTLNVSGGTVTNTNGYVGYQTGSSGTVTINGTGLWRSLGALYLGGRETADGGSASVDVSGGGRLLVGGVDPATTPASGVVVSGGSLVIRNGASLTNTADGYVGWNMGEVGTVTVMSGTWSNGSFFDVGYNGTGNLNVNGGTVTNANGFLGVNAGSHGFATVTGGMWNNTSSLTVGSSGEGALSVSGGTVTSATGYVGRFAGSVGTVIVTEPGVWQTLGSLYLGGAESANGGSATVTVMGNSRMVVGDVDPAGVSPGLVVSDNDGSGGNLVIRNGASLNSTNDVIGLDPGQTGTATVLSGTWNNSSLYVGLGGTGTLNLSGGTISCFNAYVGANLPASNSTATVTGGSWTTVNLYVGFFGTGTLNIEGGSVTTSNQAVLGQNSSASGTATVSGGTWSNTSGLTVGSSGTGILNVTDTGVVSVVGGFGTLMIAQNGGSTGTLNIGTGGPAGTLSAAAVSGGSGSATVNFDHTGSLTFAPQLTGNLFVNKLGNGTTILTTANSYTGPTNINAGTLLLSGSGSTGTGATTVSDGGTLGGDGTVQGELVVQSGGTVAPGLSPGILNANGNAGFNGDATLSIELSGAVKGQDRLAVSGTTTLSGTCKLQLAFLGEADPADLITSGTYAILSSGSLSGTFGTVTDLGVYDDGGGVTYSGSSVDLVLTKNLLGGDANLDGTTNGLDLNILGGNWLGSGNWNGGDFNGDGVVNGFDLNILGGKWLMPASVSGSGRGSGGTASAIPEPRSVAFLVLGGAALISRRRRAKGHT